MRFEEIVPALLEGRTFVRPDKEYHSKVENDTRYVLASGG